MNILRVVSDWPMSSLVRLYLIRNNIESIEAITRIEMPNLEVLVLSYNHITNISSLRKLKSKNLAWLDLRTLLCIQKAIG